MQCGLIGRYPESIVQIKSEASLLENSLLLGEISAFVLFPSTDWMKPTHHGGQSALSKVYQFKC